MNNEIQKYIISILGLNSVIGTLGILLIIAFTQYDSNLVLALIPTVTTPVSLLGGFLTGKTINEVEGETIREQILSQYATESDDNVCSCEDESA